MEIGTFTFGATPIDPETQRPISTAQAVRNAVEAGVLAEQVGLDFFGIGEHHRADMPLPNPAVVLAAVAARTTRIRLGSAITVLAPDDPVRLFEQFATLDAISEGRAEIVAGRGAAIEPFRLFGVDLQDYDALFAENLDLLHQIATHERLTWRGRFRGPLDDAEIVPRPERPIPIWVGTGGRPGSIIRAAQHRARLFLSDIGSDPARFTPLIEMYRSVAAQSGLPREQQKVAFAQIGLVNDEVADVAEYWWPFWNERWTAVTGYPASPDLFRHQVRPEGSFMAGHPEEIAARILAQRELAGHDLHTIKVSGPVPHRVLLRHIELLGTVVKPLVGAESGRRESAPSSTAD